jgi:hypothetical protein
MRWPTRGPIVVLALFVAALVGGCGGPGLAPATIDSATVDTPEAAAAAIQARTPVFDAVGPIKADTAGQDRWWEATPLDAAVPPTGWTVTFTAGWGDCEAGCIDRHSWTWRVTRVGTVTFVSEEGSVLTDDVLAGLHATAKGPGVGGRVTAGPTCPVERPGDPACAPRMVAGADLVVRGDAGAEIARLTTDGSGLFRLGLEPGEYTLEPQPVEGFMGTAQPTPFTVKVGELTWLDVAYDTGIR